MDEDVYSFAWFLALINPIIWLITLFLLAGFTPMSTLSVLGRMFVELRYYIIELIFPLVAFFLVKKYCLQDTSYKHKQKLLAIIWIQVIVIIFVGSVFMYFPVHA